MPSLERWEMPNKAGISWLIRVERLRSRLTEVLAKHLGQAWIIFDDQNAFGHMDADSMSVAA